MAEVKELCRILFDARVNPLVNIRRSRVSKDDSESGGTSANDYHSLTTETNGVTGAVTSPYELTFHCLTSELAAVLERLAASSHGFVVKSIQAKPEAELPVAGGLPGLGGAQPRPRTAGRPPTRGRSRARRTTRATAAEGPVVLLKEQRLKVDLLVCVVRALN
jgi:hypothetical protein